MITIIILYLKVPVLVACLFSSFFVVVFIFLELDIIEDDEDLCPQWFLIKSKIN